MLGQLTAGIFHYVLERGVFNGEAALQGASTQAQLAGHRIDMGFLPAPVDVLFYTSMRLGEVGLHGWDVHVPFDEAAAVPGDVVPFVLDQLPMFAGFFGKPAERTRELSVTTTASSALKGCRPRAQMRPCFPPDASLDALMSGRQGPFTPCEIDSQIHCASILAGSGFSRRSGEEGARVLAQRAIPRGRE